MLCRTILASHDQQCLCNVIDCKGKSEVQFVLLATCFLQPNLIPHYISQLLVILPQLNEESLLQLATILDPSQPTIQPLLLRAVSKKRYHNSSHSFVPLHHHEQE